MFNILDKDLIEAFLTTHAMNKNVSFYKTEDNVEQSFVIILIDFLKIDKKNVSKLLGDRLYNKYRSLKHTNDHAINEGISKLP